MTTTTTGPRVLARWATRQSPAPGAICDECAAALQGDRCDGCGQLAGQLIGMLATLVDTPAGDRIVVARRIAGGWAPINTFPATPENLRALARPEAIGPAPATVGGLL
jgi:hypothetical protein